MDIPTRKELREMDDEERDRILAAIGRNKHLDRVEVLHQWCEETVDEYREHPVEIPYCFSEGAQVTLEYLGDDSDDQPMSPTVEFAGEVVSASDTELVLSGDVRGAECKIRVDDLWAEIDMKQMSSSPVSDEGDVVNIKLTEAPWHTEYDDLITGHLLAIKFSDYDWVKDGPFMYPPEEFFEEGRDI